MGKAAKPSENVAEAAVTELEEQAAIMVHEEMANVLVEDATNNAAAELFEQNLREKEIPYAIEKTMSMLFSLVDLAFIHPDRGETEESIESQDWQLKSVIAPQFGDLDSWSRGAIPTKRKPKKSNHIGDLGTHGNNNKLPSESGRSKARSVQSRLKGNKVVGSRDGTADSKNKNRKRGQLPDYIVKLNLEQDNDHLSSKNNKKRMNEIGNEHQARTNALRDIEDRKRAAEEAKAKRVEEEKMEQDRADALAKELKGKDFTLEENGEIIVIKKINGDKLPQPCYNLDHQVIEDDEDEQEEEKVAIEIIKNEGLEKEEREKKKKKKNGGEKESEDPANNAHYRSLESFQQSVLKNPVLDVKPGVSIREGGNGKSGPEFVADGMKQMSRENFYLHQSMLESQLGPVGESVLSAAPQSVAGVEDPKSATAVKTNSVDIDGSKNKAASSTVEATTPGSAATRNVKEGGIEEDGEEYGSKLKQRELGDDEGNGEHEQISDPNLDLLNDPTWGQNRPAKDFIPGVLPSGGSPSKAQRERVPNVDIEERKQVSPRQHLPAPPLSPTSPIPSARGSIGGKDPSLLLEEGEEEFKVEEYVRDFETVANTGTIKIESDRASRIMGIQIKQK